MSTSRTRATIPGPVKVVATVAVAVVALPLVALLFRAPWSDIGRLGAAGPRTALLVSLEVSLAAAVLAFLLGVPVALVLARSNFPGRAVVRSVRRRGPPSSGDPLCSAG